MAKIWVLVATFVSVFFNSTTYGKGIKYKTGVHFDYMVHCNDHPKDPIGNVYNVSLTSSPQGTVIKADVELLEDLPKNMEVYLHLSRCDNNENLDSCEILNPLHQNNVCPLLAMRGPWSKVLNYAKPPIKCPIKKGNYLLNETYDLSSIPIIPMGNSYWKANLKLLVEKKLRFSLCLGCKKERFRVAE